MQKKYRLFLFILLYIFNFLSTKSQISKDGNFITSTNTIVNTYYSITNNINSGDNYAILSTTPALLSGDLVMIIQMQGASVNCYTNPSNTISSLPASNYGAITNYNNAGNYEFAQVLSVTNNTVTFTCPLQNNYTATGKVQLIKVPRYNNLTVNNTIYGSPWNGSVGGVVAIEVNSTLTINSSGKISADTIGFRGGRTNLRGSSPNYGVLDMGNINVNYGVYKGESIAGDTSLYLTFSGKYGKGAVANGGGGGNAVNTGGGGGANAGDTAAYNGKGNPDISTPTWTTAWNLEAPGFAFNTSSGGGRGGYAYSNSNKDPLIYGPNDYTNWGGDGRSNNGGLGGRPLDYASGRIFLGGGGGGGDADNNYGGMGGNGGGIIVILNYGQIIANNATITANGRDGYNTSIPTPPINDLSGRDGAGGGGGGGAIIIKTPNPISGNLTVVAKGGKGGDQQMRSGYIFGSPKDAYGPGGGGGGGYIGSSVSIPVTDVSGGANGIVKYVSTTSYNTLIPGNFPPNGATKGGSGIITNTLSNPQVISVSPPTVNICAGSTATALATSNSTNNINWYSTFTSTNPIASGSVFSTASYTAPGTYTVYAGTCPGIYRAAFIFTISPNPTITVNSSTICTGQTTTLLANGASSYTWNTGSNTNSLIINPSVTTTYTITGANGNCTDTKTTQVTVNPSPTITLNTDTICSGQSSTLTASGATSYTWSTGANTYSISVTPSVTTTFTVYGESNACISSKTTQIVVYTQPTLSVNNATICSGYSTTLIASGATSYTWSNGSLTNTISVNPTSTQSYTVSGSNLKCTDTKTVLVIVNSNPTLSINSPTICSNNNATLIVSGASSYTWNTGSNMDTLIVTPHTTTQYTVIGETNNCKDTTTTTVIVHPTPTISVNNATICPGGSATLVANGATSYTWNTGANSNSIIVNPTSATVYTIIGNNGNCSSTQTVMVSVGNNPTITLNNPTICNGQSATLTASGASSYTWSNGSVSNSIVVSPTTSTIYSVVGETGGCTSTKSTVVHVNYAPQLTINITPTAVCVNNCVNVINATPGFTNVMFNYGNGLTPNVTNCYNTIGIYTISAIGTYSNGCTSILNNPLSITVLNNPVASFSLPSTANANQPIQIINNSSGASLYNWAFGDGNTLNTYSSNITHTYATAGKYCVFLTAIDTAFYCSDTTTQCIVISDNFEIEIPNVFTPNTDGINDVFIVKAKGIKDFYGQIYDRWGVLLFEWNDLTSGWNGYLKNNAKAPTGSYYYIIKCTLMNGDIKEYKGYLTLLD